MNIIKFGNNALLNLHKLYRTVYNLIFLLSPSYRNKLISAPSYFPELKRKKTLSIFWAQVINILRYGEPNEQFFIYGLDIENFKNKKDYVDYTKFMRERKRLNRPNMPESLVTVLRDKLLFSIYAKTMGIKHPEVIGFIENGELTILGSDSKVSLETYLAENSLDVFIKALNGEMAKDVYHIKSEGGRLFSNNTEITYEQLSDLLKNGEYIMQRAIKHQDKELTDLHPGSINTLRLTTIYNRQTKQVEYLPPLLRVGTGDSELDNWAAGGLIIGIDPESQNLKKYGYYKPGKWKEFGKTTEHPDSKIVFEGYRIPHLQEAIEQAKSFHSKLKNIHSIGWDIAFAEGEIYFIEGNDNWEISMPQVCQKGLSEDFKRLFTNQP